MVRKVIVVLFIVLCLNGCATLQSSWTSVQTYFSADDSKLSSLATDVGSVGYRYVPQARAYLLGVCSLVALDDNVTLSQQLSELVGAAWIKSTSISNENAAMATYAINKLAAAAGLNNLEAKVPSISVARAVIKGICSGVAQAQKAFGQ